MSHTITDPAKLTTTVVFGTQDTIHTQLQTALRALAASDKIVDISISRKSVGNNFIGIITYEDQ